MNDERCLHGPGVARLHRQRGARGLATVDVDVDVAAYHCQWVDHDDPNFFLGKLAVLTASVDQDGLGSGDSVTVSGQPGRVSRWPGILMLRYDRPSGFGVVVQAPSSLGWSNNQIVDFAEGVQVTPNALQGRG